MTYIVTGGALNSTLSLSVGGVAQWLERRSLTGELSLIYA